MPINIIDRYIIRELLKIFLITVGALTSVLYLDKFLFIAENIISHGVSLLEVFLIMIYISPSYLSLTIPIGVLVASVATFNQFSVSNEWVAMKSCHLSFIRIMRPVFIFSILAYLLAVFIMVYALPWGNLAYKQKTYEIIKNRASINIKPNVFNYDFKNLVILAKERQEKFHLIDILIADTTQNNQTRIITSNQARIIPDMEDLKIRLQLINGTIHEQGKKLSAYQTINFDTYELTLNLPSTDQLEKEALVGHRELSMSLLLQKIKDLEKKGQPTYAPKVELSKKLAIPFTCLLFGILGAPLGIHSSRGGKSGGFATSVIVILLYYLGLIFMQNMGKSGEIEPYISVWIPNIILSGVIICTTYRMQKDLHFNLMNFFYLICSPFLLKRE
jgi:lipopolysaccharide export system permease protein